MAPSTAAGTSVARGYLPEIARAASHTPLMVSASPMRPRILAQPSAHGKRADMHLPATVVRSPNVYAWHAQARVSEVDLVVERSQTRDRRRCGGRPTGGTAGDLRPSIVSRRHGRESPEGRWWLPIVEVPAYHRGACFRAEHGRIDFQVIDARIVDLPLPQTHGPWNGCVGRSAGLPARGASPFHDGLDRAAHAHKQDRQPAQPSRAV